jgi:Tfp pilus assembly protein PilF
MSADLNAKMQFDQGRKAFQNRDFDKACDFFKQAVTADPQFEEAHVYLAEGYERMGYKHRARKAWEGLLRICRDDKKKAEYQQRLDALK